MPEGRQKAFELPLFQHALIIADRFCADPLARICTYCIHSVDDEQWKEWRDQWPSVVEQDVASRLLDPADSQVDVPSLLAGYFRVLEHMGSSRSFFRSAKSRLPYGVDFESYCQRIGSLTSWRVPLHDECCARRFRDLSELADFLMRPLLRAQFPMVDWSVWEESFSSNLRSLVSDWEVYNLAAHFQLA
jgi:hypothetical protein